MTRLRLAALLVSVAFVAACGGGGGSSSTSSTTGSSSGASSSGSSSSGADSSSYIVDGSSPAVTGASGQVAVLQSPAALAPGSIVGSFITSASTALSSQVQQTSGAFTTLAGPDGTINLYQHGTIADVNGAGGYVAIGRWTAGSDTQGGSYTVNQGAPYAVGNALTLPTGTGSQSCANLMATSPTAVSGSVAPGTLTAASGTLNLATGKISNFSATVTIGADTNAAISIASVPTSGFALNASSATLAVVMGNNAATPLVAIAYAATLPNTGNVNGLVVLSCS